MQTRNIYYMYIKPYLGGNAHVQSLRPQEHERFPVTDRFLRRTSTIPPSQAFALLSLQLRDKVVRLSIKGDYISLIHNELNTQ
jgi:hypothetical protein